MPRGKLFDVTLGWSGTADAPETYAVRARFEQFGINPRAAMPGCAGISGSLEGGRERRQDHPRQPRRRADAAASVSRTAHGAGATECPGELERGRRRGRGAVEEPVVREPRRLRQRLRPLPLRPARIRARSISPRG
ncbi:MAG: hypothetical protein MZW92_14975 [Comamonadaceae bacterium]|nr:hypothetical protein [Comamonadaceae bacterium]